MAVFFADSAGTQGTGDGSTAANAATLIQCIENDVILHTALVADSIIHCKNGTEITYNGAAGVFATTALTGTATALIRVAGYATTTGDGGVVEIRDTAGASADKCFQIDHDFWGFENFKVTTPDDGFNSGVSGNDGGYYRNCAVIDPLNEGFDLGAATGEVPIVDNCFVSGAGGISFKFNHRNARCVDCVSIDSGSTGFQVGNAAYGGTLIRCVSHKAGGDGFVLTGECYLDGCVSNRSVSDGFNFATAEISHMKNCWATSNGDPGGFGITGSATATVFASNCGLNPTNETNTSGKSTSVTLIENDEITADPDFVDSNPATATDVDLRLSSSSSGKATGSQLGSDTHTVATFLDVGPYQREEPAGGAGGLLTHPGMGGGMRG